MRRDGVFRAVPNSAAQVQLGAVGLDATLATRWHALCAEDVCAQGQGCAAGLQRLGEHACFCTCPSGARHLPGPPSLLTSIHSFCRRATRWWPSLVPGAP